MYSNHYRTVVIEHRSDNELYDEGDELKAMDLFHHTQVNETLP